MSGMKRIVNQLRKIWISLYLWIAELLYGPLAWAYDTVAWLVSFGYWSQWRRDVIEFIHSDPILELGYGTGELLIALNQVGYAVTGLELSAQMQRVTNRKLQRLGVNIKQVRATTEIIPFCAGVFSTVLSTFPSNYITQPDSLKEIHRVLAPGGKLIIVGLGAEFRSGWKKFLTKGIFGERNEVYIESFITKAQKLGFLAELREKQGEEYRLLILILRRNDG